MQKKEHLFNEMVRRVRKELFGKKPSRCEDGVCGQHGDYNDERQFDAGGKVLDSDRAGRPYGPSSPDELIQEYYERQVPEGMEELIGSKFFELVFRHSCKRR